ncbi:MAG: MFS transporter [Acidimicrobiales bacterium]
MTRRVRLAASDTFRSLHSRNFRLFFAGQMASMVGTWMEMVAITWLVLQLTDSGVALGLVTAAQFGPLLLLGPWGGLMADRLDRHRVMLATQASYALLATLLAVLVVSDQISVGLLYAFSAVWGMLTALDNPTRRALVIDMVRREDLPNAIGLNTAIMTGSRVVGPALAGAIISGIGVDWCFVANAVSYTAVIGALLRMNRAEFQTSPRVPRSKGQLRAGFAYARRTPELWLPLVVVAVMGTLAFNYQVTLPLLAIRSLGGDATTFTLLFATMSLGSVVGALTVARRRDLHLRYLVTYGMTMAASTLVLALAPVTAVALVAAVPLGFSSAQLISGSNAVMQMKADPAMRGRVLALLSTVFLGSTPIGGPAVGWVSETFGPRVGVGLGGVAVAAATLWVARKIRRLPDRRPTGAEPGTEAATEAIEPVPVAAA